MTTLEHLQTAVAAEPQYLAHECCCPGLGSTAFIDRDHILRVAGPTDKGIQIDSQMDQMDLPYLSPISQRKECHTVTF